MRRGSLYLHIFIILALLGSIFFFIATDVHAQDTRTTCILGFCSESPERSLGPGGYSSVPSGSSASGDTGTIQGIIISLGYFLNFVLLPLIFGIALLIFLINAVRYFILAGGSEEGQTKAKRLALYGLLAFVFLVSIWGIVNMFVSGLNIDKDESLCPDYLGNWCGNKEYSLGDGTRVPPALVDYGCGSGEECEVINDNNRNVYSPLAELIFGSYKDGAGFNFRTGLPRSSGNTPVISFGTSCREGMNTLLFAGAIEDNQSAYALYKNQAGVTVWKNLTDQHSSMAIEYDADTLNALIAEGATDIHLVHTHQKQRTIDAGLRMDGHGPSTADMELMCENVANDATFVTVDWSGLWTLTQPVGTCPRRAEFSREFPVIDTFAALAYITPADRNSELIKYVQSDTTPNEYSSHFDDFLSQNLNALSASQILALADTAENKAQLTLSRTTVDSVCATFD